MAGDAPDFSVTGFQLSEVKKLSPKAFHAGSEPITRDNMTPARSTRTAMAEHWVMILKVVSPMRKRRNILVRSARSLARLGTGTDWSAISITSAALCETRSSRPRQKRDGGAPASGSLTQFIAVLMSADHIFSKSLMTFSGVVT